MKARGCRKCTAMHGWPSSVPPRWGRLDPAASCAASRCVHQVVQQWLEGPPQGVVCRMSRAPAAQAAGRYSRGAMLPRPAAVSVRQPRIAQRRWGAQRHQRLQLAAVSGLSCAGGYCVGRLGGAQAGGGVRKLIAWAICMFFTACCRVIIIIIITTQRLVPLGGRSLVHPPGALSSGQDRGSRRSHPPLFAGSSHGAMQGRSCGPARATAVSFLHPGAVLCWWRIWTVTPAQHGTHT